MPIFENDAGKRIAFVHIPKCGGTTIERWFSKAGFRTSLLSGRAIDSLRVTPQHMSFECIKQLMGKDVEFDHAFAFVRDPYDRIESEYSYRYHRGDPRKTPDFSTWVLHSLQTYSRYPTYLDNHFRPQTYFLGEGVEVFRLEDGIGEALSTLASRLSINQSAPTKRENVSKRDPVRWSRRALRKFNELYRGDFEQLNYPLRDAASFALDGFLDKTDRIASSGLAQRLFK